jgi:hypothetical protein
VIVKVGAIRIFTGAYKSTFFQFLLDQSEIHSIHEIFI